MTVAGSRCSRLTSARWAFGISGLAIGLAGRQILENAFMGLMLYATALCPRRDQVQHLGENINGFVVDIGLFRTTIRSLYRGVLHPQQPLPSPAVLNITRSEIRFSTRSSCV